MNQEEYEEMMAKAKEEYRDAEKRKVMDKNNQRHRKWYKQNVDYVRAFSREWRKHKYAKNKDNFLKVSTPDGRYTCPRCNLQIKEYNKYKHDRHSKCGIAVNGAPEQWQCPVCLVDMNINNKWQHKYRTPCAEGFKVIEENIMLLNINDDNKKTDESTGEQTGQGGD